MVLRSTGGTVLKRRFAGFGAMDGVMEVEVEVNHPAFWLLYAVKSML